MNVNLERTELGSTEIKVTKLSLGTLVMGRLQADLPAEEGGAIVARALELGVNFIDTAQTYGTYEHVRLGIESATTRPHDLVIASKSHAKTYDEMKSAVEQCCESIGLEKVDVFHIHNVRDKKDLEARRGPIECLIEMKNAGKVVAIGASVHTIEGIEAVLSEPAFEVVLAAINILGLGINDGSLEEMLLRLEGFRRSGGGIYAMKPIAGGHLMGRVEEAINFVRMLPQVDSICVGCQSVEEVEANTSIFEGKPVEEGVRRRLISHKRQLLIYKHICKGCGACVNRCDTGTLAMKAGKSYLIEEERCLFCGYCAGVCPVFAIRII